MFGMLGQRNSSEYTVMYETGSHWSILTQAHGSKWNEVLPYCMTNVIFMIFLHILDNFFDFSFLQISNQGHAFITLIVSFLLVSRVNIGLNRYNEARGHLGTMYKELRELACNVCMYTGDRQTQADKEWRHEVLYRGLVLMRTAMCVIDYPDEGIPAWNIPELNGEELTLVKETLLCFADSKSKKYAHKTRDEWDETMRVPIRLSYLARKTIHSQLTRLSKELPNPQEAKILGNVDSFMNGYYGIRKFLTTPVPFPLIQMARTFLFLFVFTVPFVLLNDQSNIVAHCVAVFIMTYGFMGLEIVAIELDNPFGKDENDFDNDGMAENAYEDTYLTLLDVDGPEWADKLRLRMDHRFDTDKQPTEQTHLLEKIV